MSKISKNRWGDFEVAYTTFEGREDRDVFSDRRAPEARARAEAFQRAVDDLYEESRAFVAMRESTGKVLGLTDDERYDRDFAELEAGGHVRCMLPDPTWRSAMRKRARKAGLRIQTLNLTYNRPSEEVRPSMSAFRVVEADPAESRDAIRRAYAGEAQTPEREDRRKARWAHEEIAFREREEWKRRGRIAPVD